MAVSIVRNARLVSTRAFQCTTASGRAYSANAANVTLDVPSFDADVVAANGGAIFVAFSGPTSARPTKGDPDFFAYAPCAGMTFVDTTLGKLIVSNGTGGWFDASSGASV